MMWRVRDDVEGQVRDAWEESVFHLAHEKEIEWGRALSLGECTNSIAIFCSVDLFR